MEGGIQNSLDMLSQSNVLNYDASAYIDNSSPRYIGNLPKIYPPFDAPLGYYQQTAMLLPKGTRLPNQPMRDELVPSAYNTDGTKKTPTWKKLLFGGIGLAMVVFGGYKLAKCLRGKNIKQPVIDKTTTKTKGVFNKIGDFFKNMFKRKPKVKS